MEHLGGLTKKWQRSLAGHMGGQGEEGNRLFFFDKGKKKSEAKKKTDNSRQQSCTFGDNLYLLVGTYIWVALGK